MDKDDKNLLVKSVLLGMAWLVVSLITYGYGMLYWNDENSDYEKGRRKESITGSIISLVFGILFLIFGLLIYIYSIFYGSTASGTQALSISSNYPFRRHSY